MLSFIKNNSLSDYRNTLQVIAEENKFDFDFLKKAEKDELIASLITEPSFSDYFLDEMIKFVTPQMISELIYGSISEKEVGKLMLNFIRNNGCISSIIKEDLSETFNNKMDSLDTIISETIDRDFTVNMRSIYDDK